MGVIHNWNGCFISLVVLAGIADLQGSVICYYQWKWENFISVNEGHMNVSQFVYSYDMLHLLWNTILFKGNQSQDAGWPQHKTWTLLKGIQNEDAAWPENRNVFLQKWPSEGFICWWFLSVFAWWKKSFFVVLFQIWSPHLAVILVCSLVLYQSRAEKG